MAQRTWRDAAKSAIQKALQEAEAQGLDAEATEKHVRAAYPFGPRAYHPYKAWLSELKATFSPASDSKTAKAQSDMAKLKAWNEGKPL